MSFHLVILSGLYKFLKSTFSKQLICFWYCKMQISEQMNQKHHGNCVVFMMAHDILQYGFICLHSNHKQHFFQLRLVFNVMIRAKVKCSMKSKLRETLKRKIVKTIHTQYKMIRYQLLLKHYV